MRFIPQLKDFVFVILLMFMSTLYNGGILTKCPLSIHEFIESMRYSVWRAYTEWKRLERMQPVFMKCN